MQQKLQNIIQARGNGKLDLVIDLLGDLVKEVEALKAAPKPLPVTPPKPVVKGK